MTTPSNPADEDDATAQAAAEADDDREPGDAGPPADDPSPETEETPDHSTEEENRDPLEAAREEAEKWRDRALRHQADLDNYRKRMAREKGDAIKFANAGLLEDLLPVLDNFELGLQAARDQEEAGGGNAANILQGMSMVLKQIEDFLREQGVDQIDCQGAEFDPNLHEAVGHQHDDEIPEGRIISQVRKGYRLKERLLRAANVVVSKGPSSRDGAE